MKHRYYITLLCAVLSLYGASGVFAQQFSSGEIQITAPGTGVVETPGQPIQVTVAAAPGATLTKVTVLGEYPLPPSSALDKSPFMFSITPPIGSRLGRYTLSAWALDERGQTVVSAPVVVDLEPSAIPSAISVDSPELYFQAQGEVLPLRVMASFSDGSRADATESSNITYVSANANVATVTSTGLVRAVAPGTTSITIGYGTSSNLKVGVPVSVLLGGAGLAPTSLTFPSQQVGSTSASQSVAVTNQSNGPITIKAVSVSSGFAETDNCVSTSPLSAGASCTAIAVGSGWNLPYSA
jgi:hypothetical protein